MGALSTAIGASLRRRRLQSVTLGLVLLLACAAATLALSILVESRAPFDTAFAAANGAHLVIDYDSSASGAALAATASTPPVTAAAGPWPVTQAVLGQAGGFVFGAALSGRPAPDALIDQVSILAGRWWASPGEAVLGQATARLLGKGVGDTVSVSAPGAVAKGQPALGGPPIGDTSTFAIVGIAQSVSTPNVAVWMSPSDVATFSIGGPPSQQMLYRVRDASTTAALAVAAAAITAGLPADAVRSTSSYLDAKGDVDRIAQLYVPVLLAFSAFALLAAAFTITNIVSGVVMTGYREIGVMKAIGFTPWQVTRILLAQILAPVTVGAVAGVVIGTVASLPTVRDAAESFGLPATSAISAEVIIAVLAIGVVTATAAAIIPSVRAGRISSVAAISHGLAPSTGAAGRGARALGMRLPIGLPARLGVSSGFAHRARAAMTLGALVVGVAAVTLAIGLNWSLLRVKEDIDRGQSSPVRAEIGGGLLGQPGTSKVGPRSADASSAADITAAITADPQTARFVTIGGAEATASGVGKVQFEGYHGDPTWLGYELVAGRWFTGPGEAVAPTSVFTETGLGLGGTLTIQGTAGEVTVRLVGEVFDTERQGADGAVVRGAWADLQTIDPLAQASRWEMQPAAGVGARAYADALRSSVAGVNVSVYNEPSSDASFLLFLTVIGMLGIVLTAISLGGVFNTVLLETRQRTREMAVLKAIGLTPRQLIAMILASIVPIGLVAGLVGVPLGILAQHAVLDYMGDVAAQTRIPPSVFDVFSPLVLGGLALAGLAIGAVGAFGPASRAARARIAPVLQAE